MANLITHKRSSVPASVPAPGDLALGEIALNTTDKLLYIKDGANNVVALNNADNVVEGATNKFYTDTKARNAISVVDTAGDGSLSYNSATGVFTYAGISDAQVRTKLSAGGDLTYTPATGVFSVDVPDDATIRGLFSAGGDLAYNSTTGEFTFSERTDAQVRGLLNATGDISYNNTTGEISYTKQTPAQLLTAVKTVDGATSGLDSDLLDGQEGAYYLDYTNATNKPQIGYSWSVQTANFTAAVNDAAVVTTAGITATLPAAPALGDTVLISNHSGGAITAAGNGNTLSFAASVPTGQTVIATFVNVTLGWIDTNV